MSKTFEELTGVDREHYLQKMEVLHNGPCSSPKGAEDGKDCPCPLLCPLHGRCCDCIEHHKREALQAVAEGKTDGADHAQPNCIKFFKELHGIGCEANPNAIRAFYECNLPFIPLRDKE